MKRIGFATRLMAALAAAAGPTAAFGDDGLRMGVKKRPHGPTPVNYGWWRHPVGPRVAFTARSGRTIVRETVAGSDHERRLLRRKDARKIDC